MQASDHGPEGTVTMIHATAHMYDVSCAICVAVETDDGETVFVDGAGAPDTFPQHNYFWTWTDRVNIDQCAHIDEDDFDRRMIETADSMRLSRSITGRLGGLY